MKTIGENIRKYRKQRGYSQRELSELSGVHEMLISRYERNILQPKLDNLIRIANALNVSIYELDHNLQSDDDMIHVDNKELIEQLYLIIDIANGLIEKIKDTTDIQ